MKYVSSAEQALASALARKLRTRRIELHKTQEQVALEAGIDRNHYQLMESARSDRKTNAPLNPQLFTLMKVAKVLECSVIDLLEEPETEYQTAEKAYEESLYY